jgi:hypothetical protein
VVFGAVLYFPPASPVLAKPASAGLLEFPSGGACLLVRLTHLQSAMHTTGRMVFALTFDVIEDPRQMLATEADHTVAALPFEGFAS